jgi:hypothetical protein
MGAAIVASSVLEIAMVTVYAAAAVDALLLTAERERHAVDPYCSADVLTTTDSPATTVLLFD